MNFSDLEYFDYLCEVKSFTKVAEDLFVSQPSISMSIAKLERELGTKLILRGSSNKELQITEAGKIFRTGAKKIIFEVESIKQKINELNNKKVKLGVPPIISSFFFKSSIKNLIDITLIDNIDIIQESSGELINSFFSGKVDMALIGSFSQINLAGVDFQYLDEDRFILCISKFNSEYNKDSLNSIDFENVRWIVLGDFYLHKIIFKKFCNKYNLNPKNVIYATDIKTAIDFLKLGIGIGIFLNKIVVDMLEIKRFDLNMYDKLYVYLISKKQKYLSENELNIKNIIINKN